MNFVPITDEESKICNEEAVYLYGYLRKKYGNESVKDFDIILNSLCFAVARLFYLNTRPKDAEICAKLAHDIVLDCIKHSQAEEQ